MRAKSALVTSLSREYGKKTLISRVVREVEGLLLELEAGCVDLPECDEEVQSFGYTRMRSWSRFFQCWSSRPFGGMDRNGRLAFSCCGDREHLVEIVEDHLGDLSIVLPVRISECLALREGDAALVRQLVSQPMEDDEIASLRKLMSKSNTHLWACEFGQASWLMYRWSGAEFSWGMPSKPGERLTDYEVAAMLSWGLAKLAALNLAGGGSEVGQLRSIRAFADVS
jgi:hypothetical protein